jgi:pyruvate/2-oxoglutarate/acetoin dehydrogenase E1 component
MTEIASDPMVVFVGQAVKFKGTSMSETLVNVPSKQLLEFPVEEDMQLGVSIGLALNGFIPISIFPRWNFLLLAANQLVNHLDKLQSLLPNHVAPKVVIRTGVGSTFPLDPGPQHTGDFSEAFRLMAKRVEIVRLESADQILPAYKLAVSRSDGISTVLVEISDRLNS